MDQLVLALMEFFLEVSKRATRAIRAMLELRAIRAMLVEKAMQAIRVILETVAPLEILVSR